MGELPSLVKIRSPQSRRFFAYAIPSRGKKDNSATPKELYDSLNLEFHFTFDPCPINSNELRDFDGLGEWGERNFVNPPFSNKVPWIKKAIEQQEKGRLTVMLLPADTSTRWFHDLIIPNAEIRFVKGRIKFSKNPSSYPYMICIFYPKEVDKE